MLRGSARSEVSRKMHCRVEEPGRPREFHTLKIVGSNPTSASRHTGDAMVPCTTMASRTPVSTLFFKACRSAGTIAAPRMQVNGTTLVAD